MVRLDRELIGRRVVVRSELAGQTGPTGGPAMTDVVGRLVSYDDGVAVVERRDGELVHIPAASVVTAKVVPDGPQRRRTRPARRFAPDELTAICSRGWPPRESEPMGDWLLRAAGGFTRRANSVAVHGDPGLSTGPALERVAAFYAARGLPPRAHVVVGSPWERDLQDAGWAPLPGAEEGAAVQVADLAEALATTTDPGPLVEVRERADETWTALYGRAAGADPADVRAVLEGPPTVGFVRVGEPVVAIGHVAVTGEWAGLSCVEVSPGNRRQGLARRVVDASVRWASEHGADKAYLQVTRDNEAAFAVYAPYGFTDHHEYRYFSPGEA